MLRGTSPCPRFPVGSPITAPQDLFSEHGVLRVNFTYQTTVDQNGNTLFCFVTENGIAVAHSARASGRPAPHHTDEQCSGPDARIRRDGRHAGNDRLGPAHRAPAEP